MKTLTHLQMKDKMSANRSSLDKNQFETCWGETLQIKSCLLLIRKTTTTRPIKSDLPDLPLGGIWGGWRGGGRASEGTFYWVLKEQILFPVINVLCSDFSPCFLDVLKTLKNTPWSVRKLAIETIKLWQRVWKKRQITQLTSIMVHCSTTIASYVGVTTFGSLSVASWKMKTLSTDLGSSSAEREKERKPSALKSPLTGPSMSILLLLQK